MKNIIKIMITGWLALLLPLMPAAAQEADTQIIGGADSVTAMLVQDTAKSVSEFEAYDPLIPQLFAFDKKNDVFAGINNVDNKIVLLHRRGGNLEIYADYLVDVVLKRHDTHHIYRPKSVAIYDDYVVFLASHRDSCYMAVLDLNGKEVKKLKFPGEASAFSYSPSARELYIAGETATGFDVIALDAGRGINNLDLGHAAAKHYRKPRMSEVIAVEDPWGIGMTAVAMSVVFLALLLLYLVFKNVGKSLISFQDRRHKKLEEKETAVPRAVSSGDISGEVYAAITAAIHLYNEELHDEENTVLTINKVSRTYSPWSSKIHGLNTYFNKR